MQINSLGTSGNRGSCKIRKKKTQKTQATNYTQSTADALMCVYTWCEHQHPKNKTCSASDMTFICTFTDRRLKTSTLPEVSQVHAVSCKFWVKDIRTDEAAGEAEEC